MPKSSKRKLIDCREFPSDINCSLVMAGTEKEVLRVAARHAVEEHKHKDTAELRKQLKMMLKNENNK